MIKYYNGDLLKSDCDIICHQVNLQGVMGGGLALQIANNYPLCEENYRHFLLNNKVVLGNVFFYDIEENGKIIANCFSQELNFNTNYTAVKDCFNTVKGCAKYKDLTTIGVPYKYGCGIANGDWEKVENILKQLFENEPDIELRIYKL